jgi:AcrR family transcriptional regulator
MATVNSYTGVVPTPDRTSLDEIVAAARDLLETDELTMQAVAARVGVRAPSLYKRVKDRDALVRLVAEATLTELAAIAGDIYAVAGEFRAFAHRRPAAFRLVMGGGVTPEPALVRAASEPILRAAAALAGDENALVAARTFTAWANGFIGMELNRGFNLAGDVDEAWRYGLDRLVAAISLSA